MYSNTHNEEGKGHRRARSGRSSKRNSRSDTADNDSVSQRASRNEDERKARKARQKLELRAKQLNNSNEGATPGSGDLTPVLQRGPSKPGQWPMYKDGTVTESEQIPYRESSRLFVGQDKNIGLSSKELGIGEWASIHYQASGDNGIQETIERLRVSNTPPLPQTPPPQGGATTMEGASPQHRWGRVFAERGTPLSRIGTGVSQTLPPSPGTPPLQRRAAVRRKRVHALGTAITNSVDLVELSTNNRLPPPDTTSGVIDNTLDITPITTRGSICWDSPSMATPATSLPQENKTLPLHYRLPLTPTKTSPLGITPEQSTAGLTQAQNFPLPQSSSSLSVPSSPAFHTMNPAYLTRTTNLSLLDPSRRTHTDSAKYSHHSMEPYTYRSRSASPMVHDSDPRIRTIKQSAILQRSIGTVSSHEADLERDAIRHTSPGLECSRFGPGSPGLVMSDDDSQSHQRRSSKGGRVVKFRCVICMDKYRVNKMIQAPNCMHFLCITCVKDLFRRAIRNPEDGCPVQCCNATIPAETVSGFLSTAECIEYNRLVEDYNIPVDTTYCHIPTCREFIPPFSISRDSRAKCLKCHSLTCGVCKGGWHTGPCTHWERAEDEAMI